MQTERFQPEGKRKMPETRFSGIFRSVEDLGLSVCIGVRCFTIFLTYYIKSCYVSFLSGSHLNSKASEWNLPIPSEEQ